MSEATNGPDDLTPEPGQETPRDWERTVSRIGGVLGRFAQRARDVGEQAARDARPEVERLAQRAKAAAEDARPEAERLAQLTARRAKAAADAARPHVERAGRDAVRYARDHEDELKRAARVGAGFTARRVIPLPLIPIVDAMQAEAMRRPAPLLDDRADRLGVEAVGDPAPDGESSPPPGLRAPRNRRS